jgi:hypothetical protein
MRVVPSLLIPLALGVTRAAAAEGAGGAHFGGGVEIGAAMSSANADNTLTVVSPEFGLHGILDLALGGDFSLRLEPGLSTFRRSATIKVPLSIDTRPAAPVVTYGDITNDVRPVEGWLRVMLGYRYTPSVFGEIGLELGYAASSTRSDSCASDASRSGFVYGGRLSPIGVRFGPNRAIEAAFSVSIAWRPIPRCDVVLPPDFTAQPNAQTVFQPATQAQTLGVGVVGLQINYVAW